MVCNRDRKGSVSLPMSCGFDRAVFGRGQPMTSLLLAVRVGRAEAVGGLVPGDGCRDLTDGLPDVGVEARLGDGVEHLSGPLVAGILNRRDRRHQRTRYDGLPKSDDPRDTGCDRGRPLSLDGDGHNNEDRRYDSDDGRRFGTDTGHVESFRPCSRSEYGPLPRRRTEGVTRSVQPQVEVAVPYVPVRKVHRPKRETCWIGKAALEENVES